jgi:glycosyltransferase involved in cell wall biosynthesis
MTGGPGGMVVMTRLIRAMIARGHDVEFVSFRPSGTPSFPDGEALYRGIKVTFIGVPYSDTFSVSVNGQVKAAAQYLKTHAGEYDRVILDSWYIMLAAALAQVISLPHVFHLAQRDPVFEPEDDSKIWQAILFELMGSIPAQRIVVGRSVAAVLKERNGYTYPALDPCIDDTFRAVPFTVREHTPLRFVASAANFNLPWKGLVFLLQQLEQFAPRSFELTLIAGTAIEHDLAPYHYPITVTRARTPTSLRDILMRHDVYLCTSTKESFCLALAEAVTLGMPTVAMDSIGNRDYFNGSNFLFAKNERDFLPFLSEVSILETRKRLHMAARPSMERYTAEQMVQQFVSALGI